jgi:peptidoglycan hydrolase CwlO-like protein
LVPEHCAVCRISQNRAHKRRWVVAFIAALLASYKVTEKDNVSFGVCAQSDGPAGYGVPTLAQKLYDIDVEKTALQEQVNELNNKTEKQETQIKKRDVSLEEKDEELALTKQELTKRERELEKTESRLQEREGDIVGYAIKKRLPWPFGAAEPVSPMSPRVTPS